MKTITINGRLIDFSVPKIMGIINVTPDSFYMNSRALHMTDILEKATEMVQSGARFIDIGGYSSRPGAMDISVADEVKRVAEPIKEIKRQFPDVAVSIDTFRTSVAEKALEAGADMVNDISGGHLDATMYDLIADHRVPYIAMHMRGTPQTMTSLNSYDDLMKEILIYFSKIIDNLTRRGVNDILIDPGFGFAKDISQNYELLRNMGSFEMFNRPLVVGVSRKSMIYKVLDIAPDQALNGTTVLHTFAVLQGANILRVHDVPAAIEVIKLLKKIEG